MGTLAPQHGKLRVLAMDHQRSPQERIFLERTLSFQTFAAIALRKGPLLIRLPALFGRRDQFHALGSPGSRRPQAGSAQDTRWRPGAAVCAKRLGPSGAGTAATRFRSVPARARGVPSAHPEAAARGKDGLGCRGPSVSVARGCQTCGHCRCRSGTVRPRAGRLGPG